MSNDIVLDLRKVQWGKLSWKNQLGMWREKKPKLPTVNGLAVRDCIAVHHSDHPNETMLERAIRRGLLDTWTPITTFQLAANHSVTYSGAKALSMWRAWQSYVFSKQKKKGKNERQTSV